MANTRYYRLLGALLLAFGYVIATSSVCSANDVYRVIEVKQPYSVEFKDFSKALSFEEIVHQKALPNSVIINGTFFDIKTHKLAFARYTRNLNGFYGVTLVVNREILYHPQAQGYKNLDTTSWVYRTAVGYKSNGNILIIIAKCPLKLLATTMLVLGCQDAVALDGGSSSGLWSSLAPGAPCYWLRPTKKITNVYIIRKK